MILKSYEKDYAKMYREFAFLENFEMLKLL